MKDGQNIQRKNVPINGKIYAVYDVGNITEGICFLPKIKLAVNPAYAPKA